MKKLETGDTVHIAGENKTGYVLSTLPKGLVIVKFVDKTMKRYKISDLEKVKTETDFENEPVYIEFLNKEKGFKKDKKKFNNYAEAEAWGKKNFERFDSDMIKYEQYEKGGNATSFNYSIGNL